MTKLGQYVSNVPGIIVLLSMAFCFSLWSGTAQAQELELIRCGSDDWRGRADVHIGPQYFASSSQAFQFSIGADGFVRIYGPLAASLGLAVGLIDTTSFKATGGLRVHVYRSCNLELALYARGGIWLEKVDEKTDVRPMFSGGVELAHDLGELFFIYAKAGCGMVVRDDKGVFFDLGVGLGMVF